MPLKMVKKALPRKREVDVTVVGCKYKLTTEELSQISELIEVEPIPCTLEREPDNEVDPLAIKVIALDPVNKRFTGRHIGYVRRPTNEALTKLLKKRARITACFLDYLDADRGEGELSLELTLPKD